jgi:hypothetical protein
VADVKDLCVIIALIACNVQAQIPPHILRAQSSTRYPAIAANLVQYHCFDGTAWDCYAELLGTHVTTNSRIVGGGYRQEFCLFVNGASSDNNRFDTAVSNGLHGAPGWTIALWVKPVATNVANQIIWGTAVSGGVLLGAWMENTGKIVASDQTAAYYRRSRTSDPILNAGEWSHLTITARTNELPIFYVNGILRDSAQVTFSGTTTSGVTQVRALSLGRSVSAGLSGGQISYQNFTVYNRKFESNEVWQLYAGWEYPP